MSPLRVRECKAKPAEHIMTLSPRAITSFWSLQKKITAACANLQQTTSTGRRHAVGLRLQSGSVEKGDDGALGLPMIFAPAGAIEPAELVRIIGAGHSPTIMRPQEALQPLRRFFPKRMGWLAK